MQAKESKIAKDADAAEADAAAREDGAHVISLGMFAQRRQATELAPSPEEIEAALQEEAPVNSAATALMVKRLSDLLLLPTDKFTPGERGLVAEILARLVDQVDEESRARLAERIAKMTDPPVDVLQKLARDSFAVAEPILVHSRELSDPDLADIVRAGGPEHWQAVVARRHLSGIVADALIETGDAEVIEKLLRNADLSLPQSSMTRLAKACGQNVVLLKLLIARSELTPNQAYSLFWTVPSEVRKKILQRFVVSRRLMQQTFADALDGDGEGHTQQAKEALQFLVGRERGRGILSDTLRDHLAGGARDAAIAEMAATAEISEATAARIFDDPGGEALAVLAKALNLSAKDFDTLLQVASEGGVTVARDASERDRIAGIFGSLPRDAAEVTLRYWDRPRDSAGGGLAPQLMTQLRALEAGLNERDDAAAPADAAGEGVPSSEVAPSDQAPDAPAAPDQPAGGEWLGGAGVSAPLHLRFGETLKTGGQGFDLKTQNTGLDSLGETAPVGPRLVFNRDLAERVLDGQAPATASFGDAAPRLSDPALLAAALSGPSAALHAGSLIHDVAFAPPFNVALAAAVLSDPPRAVDAGSLIHGVRFAAPFNHALAAAVLTDQPQALYAGSLIHGVAFAPPFNAELAAAVLGGVAADGNAVSLIEDVTFAPPAPDATAETAPEETPNESAATSGTGGLKSLLARLRGVGSEPEEVVQPAAQDAQAPDAEVEQPDTAPVDSDAGLKSLLARLRDSEDSDVPAADVPAPPTPVAYDHAFGPATPPTAVVTDEMFGPATPERAIITDDVFGPAAPPQAVLTDELFGPATPPQAIITDDVFGPAAPPQAILTDDMFGPAPPPKAIITDDVFGPARPPTAVVTDDMYGPATPPTPVITDEMFGPDVPAPDQPAESAAEAAAVEPASEPAAEPTGEPAPEPVAEPAPEASGWAGDLLVGPSLKLNYEVTIPVSVAAQAHLPGAAEAPADPEVAEPAAPAADDIAMPQEPAADETPAAPIADAPATPADAGDESMEDLAAALLADAGTGDGAERSLGRSALEQLALDASPGARRQLFDNMAAIVLEPKREMTDFERDMIDGILIDLIDHAEPSIRAKMALQLSKAKNVPPRLLNYLAREDIRIARPLLLNSGALADADLIEILETGSKYHQITIAQRDRVSAEVAEALAACGPLDVAINLAANPGATLTPVAMDRLARMAQKSQELRDALLERPELDGVLAHRLYWQVTPQWRRYIVQTFPVDAALFDAALAQAEEAAQAAGKTLRPVDEVARSGEEAIAQFATASRRDSRGLRLTKDFAQLMNISPNLADQILRDQGVESLALACRALTRDRARFTRLFLVIDSKRPGKSSATGHIKEATAIFDAFDQDAARRTVQLWQLQEGRDGY